MKSLLAKIAIHKAVGLYFGEHEVAVSVVAATPLGSVETFSSSEPYTPETLAEVLGRLLVPQLGRKHRLPVAVGLPSSRLFFGTRLIRPGVDSTARSRHAKGTLHVEYFRRRSVGRSAAEHVGQATGGKSGRLPQKIHFRLGGLPERVGRKAESFGAGALCSRANSAPHCADGS